MFYVGQKVVAVNDPETWGQWWNRILHPSRYPYTESGKIYTVVNVYTCSDGMVMIEVAEVFAPQEEYWMAGFKASGFRPVVTRKTDISIFTRMLGPELVE